MQKIISLFQRNYDGNRLVRDEVVSGAEWVLAGEGTATRKYDGSCCMVREGLLHKRYELRRGKKAPEGFEPAQEPDANTGAVPGWLLVGMGPEDQYHREALQNSGGAGMVADGTYELCGPKVGGGNHDGADPDKFGKHVLVRHGADVLAGVPRAFDTLRAYLEQAGIEGVVWHHPDGRMVKIKARDFGLARKQAA